MRGTLSNLGYQIAMSNVGVAPKRSDLLNSWESKTGTKSTAEVVENNRVDGDGYGRKTATLKKWDDIVIKFWKDDATTYSRLHSQYFDKNTSDEDFYVDFTFIAPKSTEFASVKDYTITGQIVGFAEGDVNTTDAQSFTITFAPSGKPKEFAGPLSDIV